MPQHKYIYMHKVLRYARDLPTYVPFFTSGYFKLKSSSKQCWLSKNADSLWFLKYIFTY